MRLLLFAGKGGVGTTTVAAATAVAAARSGRRTLLLSLETAPELDTILGAGEGVGAVPQSVAPLLDACQLDPQGAFERLWSAYEPQLSAFADPVGIAVPQADTLSVPPGLDDLLALGALRTFAVSDRWDVIVVDCAAGRRAAARLALPESVGRHLAALLPAERQVARALRPVLATLAGVPMPSAEAFDAADGVRSELAAITALLGDPETTVRLVSSHHDAALAVARRMACAFALYGLVVDGLVLTGEPPHEDPDALQAPLGPLAVQRFTWTERPPAGIEDLGQAAADAYGPDADVTVTAGGVLPESGPAVEPAAEGFTYRIPLPFVERGTTGLVRHGDELVVSVGHDRRVLTLPSVLRRCVIKRAKLSGGALIISFVPDESVWMRA